ncbi:TerC family protein [Cytobacillus sp. Hm23]|uniref:TerC family protein n=1 Tax=Cytobacillus sp. IB215665 TaxID=3097357 RepID=UPI002A16C720|nr:TerC family protein [Cytobacillus sp. IB215665]MDX8364429.1 TerC family protein [Cytobacillus sp. IB215665]
MDFDYVITIMMIIGIDIVLGGDNAVVIALATRNLPEAKRNKAIFIGTTFAIIVRICLTIIAALLMTIPLLYMIGGILLLRIAYQLLVSESQDQTTLKASTSLFIAIRTIVFADIIMGLDNVIAIAGASQGHFPLVIIGVLISVPIIIWGSKLILYIMDQYPIIIYIGASILAFTAGRMITHELYFTQFFNHYNYVKLIIPYICILLVIASGYISNRIRVVR